MTTYVPRGDEGREQGQEQFAFSERVISIRRVAKVVKGGRHFSFNALVVVGDGQGRVGAGLGKGKEVPDAVRKGTTIARKSLITIPLKGNTIPQPVFVKFGAAKVIIKPASPGTGIKAGGGVRAVMEVAGVKDVIAKSLGSENAINVVGATMKALTLLRGAKQEGVTAGLEVSVREAQTPNA